MKKKYQAVVFDMDGIILDTEKMYTESWLKIAEKYNYADMETPAYAAIGVSWEGTRKIMMDFYGPEFPFDDMGVIFYQYADDALLNAQVDLKPGIIELLDYLSFHNYKIGLASSSPRSLVEKIMKIYNLRDYFDALTCGDELERSKPEPDIYLMACKDLKVNPEDAVAIEDSYNGIRSSFTAGMTPIMVPDIIGPDEEMREKAEQIFDNLHQVIGWLDDLNI